jgi:kinesin family member 5
MDGFNATIFAYGQSGSGKTFSMLGPEEVTEILVNQSTDISPDIEALFGIVPRSTFHIFDIINEGKQKGTKYTIKVSYIEIYNESINDILSVPPAQNLKLREFPNQGMCVIGMQENIANSPEAVFEVISAGTANKIVCSTGQNARSSRSHTVFILTCEQTLLDGSSKVSKINLVDLAGSEKLSKTGAQGQALKEAQKINLSLTTLGRCIKALTSKGGDHIPFRESKLTLILKESLGGNSKTTLIVTGSMRKVHQDETISTMLFAERAKLVKTAAKSNVKRSVEELEMMVEQMKGEIIKLHTQLKNGGQMTFIEESSELQELKIKYISLQNYSEKQIEELTDALERSKAIEKDAEYSEERKKLLQIIEDTNLQLERAKYEKETERKVYEEFIEEISVKSQDSSQKLIKSQQELNSISKEISILRFEIQARDELLTCLSQENQNFLVEKNEYLEMIAELKQEINTAKASKLELNKEINLLKVKVQETISSKSESDIVIDKLEYYAQSLQEKNESLESDLKNLSGQIEEYKSIITDLRVQTHVNQGQNPELKERNEPSPELSAENSYLKAELKKAQEEIQVLSSVLNDSSSSDQSLAKMKQELDKALNDKEQILSSLQDFKLQFEDYESRNILMHKEHDLQAKTIALITIDNETLNRKLEIEKENNTKLINDLKFYENNYKKLVEDIERNVKIKMQLDINAFVQQINELQESLLKKEKEINEFKGINKEDYLKTKNELSTCQNNLNQVNSQMKVFIEEFEQKMNKILKENEELKDKISDKLSENLRLKMDLSDKDSLIYQLKIKNEQLQSNPTGQFKDQEITKYRPSKLAMFTGKKNPEKIPQAMIKSLYTNIDNFPDIPEDDQAVLED